jgi:uncharacterized repeat protein (TIGR01451 family)
VTLICDNVTNQNFTNTKLGSIIGRKTTAPTSGDAVGWRIDLITRPGGVIVNTTYTNSTRWYNFTNVPLGDYWVNETLIAGYYPQNPSDGSEEVTIDCANLSITGLNFNNRHYGSISGYKLNETGQPLQGWTITLKRGNTIVGTVTTNESGYYNFTNLTWATNYLVNETLQNCYINLTPANVSVVINGTNLDPVVNFTNKRDTGALNITKTANVTGTVYPGQVIGYNVTVCNTGNLTLSNVTIQDTFFGTSVIGTLNKSECRSIYPSHVVNVTDVCRGWINNTASANATDPCGALVATQGTVSLTLPVERNASMSITKTANVTGTVYPGQVIGYNVTVCNTGNLTLSNVTVQDTFFGTSVIGTLNKSECASIRPNHTVIEQDVCRGWINNTASANATDPCGGLVLTDPNVTVSLPVSYNASLSITKTANTTGPVGLNDIITYNITVCNTGNMTLDVQVFDNRTGIYVIPGLLKGQCNSTLRTYSVSGDDCCNGSVINYAYANGTDTCGNSVYTRPNATVTIPTRPSGNISGIKFNDLNGNGVKDINDNPLSGWTINLYYAGNGTFISSAVTNAAGEFRFQNLPCGLYRVNETQNASWNQTAPPGGIYTVQINGTSMNVTGRDFGNQQKPSKCACPTRAYWTFAQIPPNSNHAIQFTDTSTGYPVEWNWSFGDGTYSNLKSPLHVYSKAGQYKVIESVKVCGCTGQVYWTSYTKTITVK